MKSFKSFMVTKKKNSGVIPAPIHFKICASNRNFKEDWTPRPLTPYQNWLAELPNKNLAAGPHYVSNKLAETNNYSPEEEKAIEAYSAHHDGDPDDDAPDKKDWHSYQINSALINNKPIPSHLKDTEAGLESAIRNNPIRHNVHVFSGLSFNPMDHVDENGRMTSPAYISATHDKYIAAEYAGPYREYAEPLRGQSDSHIMEIHLKSGDPATHIERVTLKPDEHETLINKGVTLKHLKTETLKNPDEYNLNRVVHVHHFAVER
jgi:hypothetical protein